MKIVQLLPELNEGGVERGVVELNRELVKQGIDSSVISAGGRLTSQIEADGGQHIQFDAASKNPCSVPSRIRGLRKIFTRIQPEIIHARSRVPAWLAYLANRNLKIPFITTVHGFNSVNAYSRVMTYGDKVICVSNAIRDYVIEHYSVPKEKLIVIPRGVDLEQFDPERVDTQFMHSFGEQYHLGGKFVVTTVGRITQLKDYETFIKALGEIKQQKPDAVGLIVGGVRDDKQGYYDKLQKLVQDLNAGNYIHFVGNQQNVAEIYALSNVIVSSSKKPESFGRSAAEALAMNIPVAASGHGGILDIVLPGKTGQLFNPGDSQGLVKAILDCTTIQKDSLREFVESNFTLENMVNKTLLVYRQMLSKSI